MVYRNNSGRLGCWLHQCVLRNTRGWVKKHGFYLPSWNHPVAYLSLPHKVFVRSGSHRFWGMGLFWGKTPEKPKGGGFGADNPHHDRKPHGSGPRWYCDSVCTEFKRLVRELTGICELDRKIEVIQVMSTQIKFGYPRTESSSSSW
jgi:hypothetical protein